MSRRRQHKFKREKDSLFPFIILRKDGRKMFQGKKVYICSPLTAPSKEEIKENMLLARQYMKHIEEDYHGRAFAPHGYLPELFNDHIPEERALVLELGLQILYFCDYLVICGDIISSGMRNEIQIAQKLGIKIYQLTWNGERGLICEYAMKVSI